MRTTIVTNNYWPSVGGAQLLVQRVAEGFATRAGDAVEVLTVDALHSTGGRDPGSVGVPVETLNGVTIRRFPLAGSARAAHRAVRRLELRLRGRHGNGSRILSIGPLAPRLYLAMWRALRSSDAVVVVNTPLLIVAAHRLARLARRPLVLVPLLHPDDPVYPAVLRAFRAADAVLCLTDHERTWLAERGVTAAKMVIVPPGCDLPSGEPPDPSTARTSLGLTDLPTVGFIGRLAAHKGVDTFLESARLLRSTRTDPGTLRFLLAGSRTNWDDLDRLIDEGTAGPDPWLEVVEQFDDADKATLYAACDVVVFPSRSESFGIVILESWAARRAVVASDIGAVRCVIRDGTDGLLVPPRDAAALAAAIARLLDDPDLRRRLAEAGRARLGEFDWSGIVDRWHAVVEAAASGAAVTDARHADVA